MEKYSDLETTVEFSDLPEEFVEQKDNMLKELYGIELRAEYLVDPAKLEVQEAIKEAQEQPANRPKYDITVAPPRFEVIEEIDNDPEIPEERPKKVSLGWTAIVLD